MAIAPPRGKTLEQLEFANSFAALGDAFSERRVPLGVPNARLVAWSPDAAGLIELDAGEAARAEFTSLAAGDTLLPGMEPVAAMYGGHQFGVWAGQLGDGRAILLGEVRNSRGEPWELQLKGAGVTAFSRFGDGRAVVRSTVPVAGIPSPASTLHNVVLPAPLRPTRPTRSPEATRNVAESSSRRAPARSSRPVTVNMTDAPWLVADMATSPTTRSCHRDGGPAAGQLAKVTPVSVRRRQEAAP